MTYSKLVKIISVLYLVPLAVYTASQGWMLAIVSFTSLGLFFYYFIFRSKVDFWLQNKGWRSLHWFESLSDGGVKEATIYRALTEFEKEILGYSFLQTQDKNFDLDRRSPVFRIIGELARSGEGESEIASVRGFKISRSNSTDQKFQLFAEGTTVGVEFSPFSKKVWETYAVIGERRVWQMDFPEKSIPDIRSGKRTVDLRAPFGSHNLDQFQSGDYITFSDRFKFVNVTVTIERISVHNSLEVAIQKERVENILPDSHSEIAAVSYFRNLPSYEARVKQGKVYAIKFAVEKNVEINNLIKH